MQTIGLSVLVMLLAMLGYHAGVRRARSLSLGRKVRLLALPSYYGAFIVLCCAGPALLVVAAWLCFEPVILKGLILDQLAPGALPIPQMSLLLNEVRLLSAGGDYGHASSAAVAAAARHYHLLKSVSFLAMSSLGLTAAGAGIFCGLGLIRPELRVRRLVEGFVHFALIACSAMAIVATLGIVLVLLYESLRFFGLVHPGEFLFGAIWSPQTSGLSGNAASPPLFGAVPLFAGSLLIAAIAMALAVPVGLFSAIHLAEYASLRTHRAVKPLLDMLAGIPTVVYGYFAALTVAPFFRSLGEMFGLSVAGESALSVGIVVGVMIIPVVSARVNEAIRQVPQSLRLASYGLGATRAETIRQVVLPAAMRGIVGAFLLALSRAIGETMIVVMAAGLAATMTANPLRAVTTVTVQIISLLAGDQRFDSARTLAAFALGLMLFAVTFLLNVVALRGLKTEHGRDG